jgi:hypothetical protein
VLIFFSILVKEMLRSAPAKNLLRQGFSLAGAKFAPAWLSALP